MARQFRGALMLMVRLIALIFGVLAATVARGADAPQGLELFEQHIRPILVEQCYKCHSAGAAKVKGKLLLDTKQGMAKGGEGGAILIAGQPEKSRLIQALQWTDPDLEMPPKKQLSPQQIQWFEAWVKLGAPDPREQASATVADNAPAAKHGMDLETGRKWWAFQKVREITPQAVKDASWVKRKSDQFIAAKLEEARLEPSPQADRRTLIRRAYLDLTGLRPTYDEVEAFAKDQSPGAYEKLVDRLLASEHYGERWGRYWLDVVRYAEDNPTSEATNPPYPFAWRYRDWVIKALNQDVPYDRFVKLQLAADEMPGTTRQDMVALGFLGVGPVYHKDGRLSKDVITTLYTDDWDERIDTVTRGFLGMTVACARCHDHKFYTIPTKDYYSLQGVFSSIVQVPRPLAQVDPEIETRFMSAEQRLFYLSYAANLLRGDPGSKPKEARGKVEQFVAEMVHIKEEMSFLQAEHSEMYAQLDRLGRLPPPYPGRPWARPAMPVAATQPAARIASTGPAAQFASTQPATRVAAGARPPGAGAAGAGAAGGAAGNTARFARGRRGGRGASTAPFFQGVFDAGTFIDATDGDFTMIDIKPGEARDMCVLPAGNVARPGAVSPRKFLSVLSTDDSTFHVGSGRRELGDKIFSDGASLAARVIVNRVWALALWQPIVATQSDFGVQGEKPTHPQLLDDLAARFIANGWSLKWLHKEIMLSSAYRQSSAPREDAEQVDSTNKFLWRMNPRRLDIEAYRDSIMHASGTLSDK